MNLYMKQEIFTWGDKFWIYDQQGNGKYYVEGEVFSFGKKLHMYDVNNQEVAYIQQKLLSFLPKYEIYDGESLVAEVVKDFTFFHQRYEVNGPGWVVEGDFFDHEYQIMDGNGVIAAVSKEWFTFGDAYQIQVADHVKESFLVAIVLVIDACIDAQRND
ncbi:MAG: LURP-one-related family protein [Lachnospiraceae bacterium]|nr:LURP-one-related family protein [Lachnospiraceae bacterium]